MDSDEIEKLKAYKTVEIVEYVSNAVVIKTIVKKSTGNIRIMSFDSGEGLNEKTIPFDTFAQIIDGEADIVIDGKPNFLKTGESILIPAHATHFVNPHRCFKMILTVIKSGYDL